MKGLCLSFEINTKYSMIKKQRDYSDAEGKNGPPKETKINDFIF
jgi:hypothetical protein